MRFASLSVIALALQGSITSQVSGQPYTRVQVFNYSSGELCGGGSAWDEIYSGTGNISVSLNACAETVYIYSCFADGSPGAITDMPRVTLSGGPATLPVRISLGFTFSQVGSAPTPVGANWGGLDARALANSQFFGGINGNLTGGINVDQLFRFDALGDVRAEIRSGGAGNGGVFVVHADEIIDDGTVHGAVVLENDTVTRVQIRKHSGLIEAMAGSITELVVTENVTGRIYAEQGSFGNFNITGALESPDSPGGIWPIRSKNGINTLRAGSISANITAATNGGLGKVGLIKTTNGPMTKGLALKELITPVGGGESGIIINGSFPSTASIRFLPGAPRTRNILVRDSFAGEIRYDHPAALDTQIVVNAGNTGGVWTNTGKVVLNSNPPPGVTPITLSPSAPSDPLYLAPNYDATPSQLGGGSIGVVPFALHDLASSPANPPMGVPPTPINMGTNNVVLEFYGPVRAESTADPIKMTFVSTTWPVAVDATEWFNWSISGRTLTVVRDSAWCLPPGSYTISPNRTGSDRLLCNVAGLTGGASVAVADFDYLFEVNGSGSGCPCYTIYECAPCAADFDNNGGVDGGDLAAFFLNYEQGCPCADVDGNGGVDGGDLGFFFAAYEAGGC